MLSRIFPQTHRFRCPDEHQLAAYVDQQLIGAERERVESHLAKCDSCLQQVGFLIQQSERVAEPPPSLLVRRATKLQMSSHGNPIFGWAWISLAAAILVIAIGTAIWRETRPNIQVNSTEVAKIQQPAPVVGDKARSEADNAVRSISPSASLPVVLSPQPGAIVHASDFIIRWEPIPNAAAYEVRVVTADGNLIWSKRVHKNSAGPPEQMLRSGVKYFVWVRAWLTNGKTQQSESVGFIGG